MPITVENQEGKGIEAGLYHLLCETLHLDAQNGDISPREENEFLILLIVKKKSLVNVTDFVHLWTE